jgi:hypothetical protein
MLGAMPAGEERMERRCGGLPLAARATLEETGFVVLPGPFSVEQLNIIADVYDAEVQAAVGDDIRVGATSTRVVDFVNRGPLFDPLYVYPPLLDAAAQIVGPSFKLSTLNAKTLRPGASVLDIHVDVESSSKDWPLLGFILMIDTFTPEHGATRFVPGSHRWSDPPKDDRIQDHARQLVSACGTAGSLLMFDGSTWHGQGLNCSDRPRRSLQGAFIPRGGQAGTDFHRRMTSETHSRLGPIALHVLGIPDSGSCDASLRIEAREFIETRQ